jgi:helix-turn-helix protein/ricin-type beta-trefoil lectin protein
LILSCRLIHRVASLSVVPNNTGTGEGRAEMADAKAPDPQGASTPTEFVLRMQAMKDWSGFTYRQLAARAEQWGDALPASTLASTLGRRSLPRPEVVTAFVRACGGSPADVEQWLQAHRAVADGTENVPATEGGGTGNRMGQDLAEAGQLDRTEDNGTRVGAAARRRLLLLVAASALLILVTGGYLLTDRMSRDDKPADTGSAPAPAGAPLSPGTPSGPVPGVYRIRSAVSALCLSERDGESGGGNVYQSQCVATGIPAYALEQADSGLYRIRSLHPVFGYGCLGVAHGSTHGGAQMMDDYCGHRGTAEHFRLRPAGTAPHQGYRIVLAHTGACVSIPGRSTREWTPVLQLPCAASDPGQIFRFDPMPSPSAVPTISSN